MLQSRAVGDEVKEGSTLIITIAKNATENKEVEDTDGES